MEASVSTPAYPKEIATAIAQVMGADLYVQKRGKNAFHGYKYATVGDVLDKLQPLMAEAGLVIFQHEVSTDLIDGANVMATRYEFTLAHTSGAVWPEKPIHTGMSACRNTKGGFDDKAANKCHTAARKYFLLGLFQVPTGEDYREAAHDAEPDAQDDARPAVNGKAPAEPRDPVEFREGAKNKGAADREAQLVTATAYKDEIKAAIEAAKEPAAIDRLIKTSGPKLEFIKTFHAPTYDRIMGLATARSTELLASA